MYCIPVSENKMSYSFLTTGGVIPAFCHEGNAFPHILEFKIYKAMPNYYRKGEQYKQ